MCKDDSNFNFIKIKVSCIKSIICYRKICWLFFYTNTAPYMSFWSLKKLFSCCRAQGTSCPLIIPHILTANVQQLLMTVLRYFPRLTRSHYDFFMLTYEVRYLALLNEYRMTHMAPSIFIVWVIDFCCL